MKRRLFFPVIVLLAVSLACGTPGPTEPTEEVDIALVNTIVAATMQAVGEGEALPSSVPTETPLANPTATNTSTPLPPCQPPHPGAEVLPLPVGFAAGTNTNEVAFYDTNGNWLASKPTPGLTWLEPGQVHIGGGMSMGIPSLPLIYFSLGNGGVIKSSANGTATQIVAAPDWITLTGGVGRSFIAYSTDGADIAAGGWISNLYAGEANLLGGAVPQLTRSEGDGFVFYPLAVQFNGEIRQGVWYTLSMWGIGNINFAPYNGLNFLNFDDGTVTKFLPFTDRLAGLSPDHSLVALIPGAGGQPGGPGDHLTLRNLITCQETQIPFHASTTLGGGFVFFSPDNQYVAWLEASGPSNMEAQMRLRVARTLDGTILADAEIVSLSSLAGGEVPYFLKPVGWLANHLLLVEINILGLDNPILVVWAPDPSQPLNPVLGANQSAALADGTFLGFLYP
jgi:hypothetical protein